MAADSLLQEIPPALLQRPRHHGRTQSTTPSSYAYRPDSSPSSTSYHGAGGDIVDDGPPVRYSIEDSTTTLSGSATPTRQPLGQRLLSAVSGAQPTAAGLNRSKSVLHSRAKSSFAAFVSRAGASNTLPEEPQEQQHHQSRPHKLFGDLFNGESAPVRFGPPFSPSKEDKEDPFTMPDYKPTFTERPTGWLRRQSTTLIPPCKL